MAEISIVLPTYNGEKYIREAVDSIIKQTFTDWELIIVDDCSVDNTSVIAEEYASNDCRIKVINNQKNQKLPKSLNIGFRNSVGEFLTWTSDDNYFLPDALEKMHGYLLENNDVYMVCAGMDMVDSDGNLLERFIYFDKEKMFYNNCVGACFMYKRKVLEELGEYDENMFLVEDYEYWLRVLKQYGHIGHINDILYVYRNHKGSLTATKREQIEEMKIRLNRRYFDWILDNLGDKSYICRIYYELIEANEDMGEFEEKIYSLVPELGIDLPVEDAGGTIIIFGAGAYGEKAADCLGDKAAYFADSNKDKVGTYKKGIKIISAEELINVACDYNILISVSSEKIFEILSFLYNAGIKKCGTYQKLIKREKYVRK